MVDAWNNHRCSFVSINSILQFVQIWGQVGQTFFQSLPLLTILDDCERFAGFFHGIALHHLPMVKHTLRESLASSIRPQVGGETWKNNQNHEKSWIPKKKLFNWKRCKFRHPKAINGWKTSGGNREWFGRPGFHHWKLLQKVRKWELTERFVDRQVSLDVEHGSSGNLVLFEHVSTTTIEHTINSTDSVFRALKTF